MFAVYAKSLVYVGLALIGFLITALTDGVVTTEESLNAAVVVLGAVVVYIVPNLREGIGKYAKSIAALLTAAIVALLSVLSGGVTLSEWLQVIVAACAGIGVFIVPNAPAARAADDRGEMSLTTVVFSATAMVLLVLLALCAAVTLRLSLGA